MLLDNLKLEEKILDLLELLQVKLLDLKKLENKFDKKIKSTKIFSRFFIY
jgi:hypothetical protein